jgi:hypothetical protein
VLLGRNNPLVKKEPEATRARGERDFHNGWKTLAEKLNAAIATKSPVSAENAHRKIPVSIIAII